MCHTLVYCCCTVHYLCATWLISFTNENEKSVVRLLLLCACLKTRKTTSSTTAFKERQRKEEKKHNKTFSCLCFSYIMLESLLLCVQFHFTIGIVVIIFVVVALAAAAVAKLMWNMVHSETRPLTSTYHNKCSVFVFWSLHSPNCSKWCKFEK